MPQSVNTTIYNLRKHDVMFLLVLYCDVLYNLYVQHVNTMLCFY